MTKPLLIVAIVITASVFGVGDARGQKKSEPAASNDSFFSSDSNLVLVDSTVTDKKGDYIADLTRKNFKVREDNKEQTITSFSYEADGTPDDQKRFLVLLFDDSTVPQVDQHYARDAAMKFIGSNAGPNRLMAVVEFDGTLRVTQNLTDDVEKLRQAVTGSRVAATSAFGAPSLGGIVVRPPNNDPAKSLMGALENLAKGLARVPGRKTLVLFSEGTNAATDQVNGAVGELNRSNVATYPVDIHALGPKGTGTTGFGDSSLGRTPPAMMTPAQNAAVNRQAVIADLGAPPPAADLLYGLAKGTGGFVVSSSGKLPDDMNRIGKEQSQYYVLGYLPANSPQPGACHKIKVEVDRGGANVRARSSYCDEATPEVVAGTAPERDLEARLNAGATPTVAATMQTPFFYVAPNMARVDMALDISGAGIKFAKDKGKFAAALNIIGIAYLPDGAVAARFNDVAKVILDDQQQVDEFASRPYHFEKQFEIGSGKLDLKVAFSSGAANFGTIETQLTIDPWEPSKFLLSGLALSQTTRPASPAGLGQVDLFGDQVPLVVNGAQVIPAGTGRLRKSDKVYLYGEIYEPALATADRKDDPGVGEQLTVLNARTGEVVAQSGFSGLKPETVPGTSAVPFGLILPADQLAPGAYTARITAKDAAGNNAVRAVDFELQN